MKYTNTIIYYADVEKWLCGACDQEYDNPLDAIQCDATDVCAEIEDES